MNKMKRTWSEIDEINVEYPEETSGEEGVIRETFERVKNVRKQLITMEEYINKQFIRAREVDPEKQFYGPQTNKTIVEYHQKYESLRISTEKEYDRWLPLYLPLQHGDERDRLAKEEQQRKFDEMKRQAMAQLQKADAERILEEDRVRLQRLEDMKVAKRRKIDEDAVKEREKEDALDAELDFIRKLRAERLRKRREMEDMFQNAKGHTFEDALKMIKTQNPKSGVESCKRALTHILTNLIKHPDMEEMRKLRVGNPRLHADLFKWKGGKESLISLGFELRDLSPPKEQEIEVQDTAWFLIMNEPDPKIDVNAWEDWHNDLRRGFSNLDNM